jgi:hypothetical protein
MKKSRHSVLMLCLFLIQIGLIGGAEAVSLRIAPAVTLLPENRSGGDFAA